MGNITHARTAKGKRFLLLLPSEKYQILSDVSHTKQPGFKGVSQKPKIPHPITSPIYALPFPPYIRCDALFHCDINNHSIIVQVHTSYQEIKKIYTVIYDA